MELLRSLCAVLSTYTVLPMPLRGWDGNAPALSFCFLPVAGVIVGAITGAWLALCRLCGTGTLLKSAVCTAIPVLVTGGIHLDGFCDTVDALCSHRDREKSLEIMKDPRAGAFAAVYCALCLLLHCALSSETAGKPLVFCLIPVMSRAVSVLSVTGYPNARGGGMLAEFQKSASRSAVRLTAWAWIAVCACAMFWGGPFAASGALMSAAAAWRAYHAVCLGRFGGITGDTSGFFVVALELAMMAGMYAGECAARFWGLAWTSC